jgi:hypothetical protein
MDLARFPTALQAGFSSGLPNSHEKQSASCWLKGLPNRGLSAIRQEVPHRVLPGIQTTAHAENPTTSRSSDHEHAVPWRNWFCEAGAMIGLILVHALKMGR